MDNNDLSDHEFGDHDSDHDEYTDDLFSDHDSDDVMDEDYTSGAAPAHSQRGGNANARAHQANAQAHRGAAPNNWNAGAGSSRGHGRGLDPHFDTSARATSAYEQYQLQAVYNARNAGRGQQIRQGAQTPAEIEAQIRLNAALQLSQSANRMGRGVQIQGSVGNNYATAASGAVGSRLPANQLPSHFGNLSIASAATNAANAAVTQQPHSTILPLGPSTPTQSVFITLYTMVPIAGSPTSAWRVVSSRDVPRRPGGGQLRQGRSVPPPPTSPEWNVWTLGDLHYENARGGLHLDYFRDVLLRLDGVSRKKVNRTTLVSLIQAERQRQIAAGCVVDCPPYYDENSHWYNYVQPM